MGSLAKYLQQLFLVEKDEAGPVFYFLIFFLIIGCGMALGSATANALFLKRFGIDYLPLTYLAQGGMSFIAIMIYASVADIIPAERFFKILFALLAATVLIFWALISLYTNQLLFPAYFLFYEVVSEILLIHGALYLNQNLNLLQAKRLSPIIFSGLQIGTILGGLFLATFAPILGTHNILTVWLALLLLALLLITLRHKLKGPSPHFRATRKSAHNLQRMVTHIQQGFRFAWNSELLRLTTIAMVFMVITYYIINYSVKRVYTDSYVSEGDLTAFFGMLTMLTSTLALALQLLLTNRLIQRFGVPTVNLLYPLASLGSLAGMIFHLGLPTAITASININTIMPAFHNPVRMMFLNVLPQQTQGRARAMSMAIVIPISLIFCGLLLLFLQKFDDPLYFLVPGITAAGLFFYFSTRMNHAYGKTLLTHLKEHLFLPEEQAASSLRHTGKENIAAIVEIINRGNESSVSFARILAEAYPEIAANHILPVIEHATPDVADQLLKIASSTHDPAVNEFLLKNAGLHDNHLHATALTQLINSHSEEAIPLLRQALKNPDPRIRATGIHGVLSWPLAEHQAQATNHWLALLKGSKNEQLAAHELIPNIEQITTPSTRDEIEHAYLDSSSQLFDTQNSIGKVIILNAYRYWEGPSHYQIQQLISDAMEHTEPRVRAAAVCCVHLLSHNHFYNKLEQALGDGHALVRKAATEILREDTPDAQQLAIKWIYEDNRGTPRAQKTLLSGIIDTIPQSTLELMIKNKIEDAHQIYKALLTVRGYQKSQSSALKLLQHLLEERLQQIIDVALTAMEPLYASNTISVIRAGIRTLDDRYIANACEALNSIPNQALAQPLGQLIEDAFMSTNQGVVSSAGNIETVLESLAIRPDTWLQQCTNSALLALRRH